VATLALALASCQEQAPKPPMKPVEDPATSSLLAAASRSRPLDPITLSVDPYFLRIPLDVTRPVSAAAVVTNTGDRPAEGLGLRVAPSETPITVTSDCLRAPIQPGASCKLEVTANPSRVGATADLFLEGPGVTTARLAVTTVPPSDPAPTQGPQIQMTAPPPPLDPIEQLRRQAVASEMAAGWGMPPAQPQPAPTLPMPLPPAASPVPIATVSPPRDLSRMLDKTRYILLTLENEILTTRTGTFTAVVSLPLYENPAIALRQGRSPRVLLDQGTRFTGDYDAQNTVASRNLLRFTELRDPYGRTLRFQGLQSMDPMGRAGTPADVEQLGTERFAAGLLGSIVSLVPLLTVAQSSQQSTSALGTVQSTSPQTMAAQKLSQDISDLTRQAIRENMDRSPRASIPAGTTIVVQPDNDWYFPADSDPLTASLAPPQPPQPQYPQPQSQPMASSGQAPTAPRVGAGYPAPIGSGVPYYVTPQAAAQPLRQVQQ
jgi:hypothetical protein